MKFKHLHFLLSIFLVSTSCILSQSENDDGMDNVSLTQFIGTQHSPSGLPSLTDTTQEKTTTLVFTPMVSETKDVLLSDDFLGPPMIVVIGYWYDSIIVQDVKTGEYREIYNEDPVGFWGWANNGCELIIGPVGDFKGSIIKIDLQGNILEEIITFNWDDPWGIVENVSFSPSEDFVAYVLSDYEDPFDRDPSLYNLYISPIDQPQDYTKLSENDGVWEATWSSTDSLIAYPDFDKNSVHQLYVSNPTGTDTVQLTSFNIPGNEIHSIVWSPDGRKIAFYNEQNGVNAKTDSINIISVSTENTSEKIISIVDILEKEINLAENIWWEDGDTLVADLVLNEFGSSFSGMYWIDITAREVIKQVLQDETPEKSWSDAILIDNKVWYYFGDYFWIYNISSGKVEFKVDRIVHGLSAWFPAPSSFRGEEFCNH